MKKPATVARGTEPTNEWNQEYPRDNRFHDPLRFSVEPAAQPDEEDYRHEFHDISEPAAEGRVDVPRYVIQQNPTGSHWDAWAEMVENKDGAWVKIEDVEKWAARASGMGQEIVDIACDHCGRHPERHYCYFHGSNQMYAPQTTARWRENVEENQQGPSAPNNPSPAKADSVLSQTSDLASGDALGVDAAPKRGKLAELDWKLFLNMRDAAIQYLPYEKGKVFPVGEVRGMLADFAGHMIFEEREQAAIHTSAQGTLRYKVCEKCGYNRMIATADDENICPRCAEGRDKS